MKVKIFRPAKSAMQSGKRNIKKWLMEPIEENNIRSVSPVTGWVSASNTSSQLEFVFENKEEAIKFAEKRGFEYEVEEPKEAVVVKKSYAANFTG
ncbi:MAG: NADH dehydrogenase ubiquinone Fe-S protein 4 [Pseudomonadota bacterium]